MSEIVLLDTSIYLNVLDVPGWNQDRDSVLAEFGRRLQAGDYFLLPLAAVWETGNHIAHLSDGDHRRSFATKLATDVKRALGGELPYQPTYFPTPEVFGGWLDDFPGYAHRSKSAKRTREGISLADMTIIKEWELACRKHRMSTVLIWSLDADLMSYHRAM